MKTKYLKPSPRIDDGISPRESFCQPWIEWYFGKTTLFEEGFMINVKLYIYMYILMVFDLVGFQQPTE